MTGFGSLPRWKEIESQLLYSSNTLTVFTTSCSLHSSLCLLHYEVMRVKAAEENVVQLNVQLHATCFVSASPPLNSKGQTKVKPRVIPGIEIWRAFV